MALQTVRAIQDESGHWYVIPEIMADEFREMMEVIYLNEDDYAAIKKFEEKFGKYRTGGDLNNIQLYADL